MKAEVVEPVGFSVPPVLLVSWFALCAAYLELAYMGGQKLYRHVIFASPHIAWMTPLAYLILFSPLVLAILFLRRVVPPVHQARFSLFLLSAVLAFSFLSIFWVTLGPLSTGLLATGVAMQLTRTIAARQAGFARLVRVTLPWMFGFVLLAGAAMTARGWYRQRAAPDALVGADRAPNVIFLVLDTVRGMSMSLYGYSRQTTPGLERFAAQGVVFEEAYSAAPWTLPSIATMFTGRYPHEHGADWTAPLPEGYPTLAEVFRDAGYATAGFVANTNYSSAEVGLDRGFMHFEDYTTLPSDVILSASPGRFILNNPKFRRVIGFYETFGRKNADRVNAGFTSWLATHTERPFFAYLNYYDAHEPYLPPSPFDTQFGPDSLRKNWLIHQATRAAFRKFKESMTAAERAAEQRAYDGSIAYLDSRVERLLTQLDRLRLSRETIVIITSDHGELFGEHGLFSHGNSLYLPLLRVPLLLRAPSLPAGVRIATPVTLRDLPRTVLELAGLDGRGISGESFARLAAGGVVSETGSPIISLVGPAPNTREEHPVFKGPMWSIISRPYQYILEGDGSEELYDFVGDPGQTANLASAPQARPILDRLREGLDSARRK